MQKLLTILILSLFATACSHAPTYLVGVNGINTGRKTAGKAFVIANYEGSELVKQEFTNEVSNALAIAGFTPVKNIEDADIVVSYIYTSGSSTGVASSPTYQWIAPKQYNYNNYSSGGYSSGTISEGGIGHMAQTGAQSYTYVVFTHVIDLSAYDAYVVRQAMRNGNQKAHIPMFWETKVAATDSKNNSRHVFPAMLAVAANKIGADTRGIIQLKIKDGDDKIDAILGYHQDSEGSEVRDPASTKKDEK